tara:strand:+ start:775 stop:942 length:168 start_codon:yes stop_codon:yes gene_type:complete
VPLFKYTAEEAFPILHVASRDVYFQFSRNCNSEEFRFLVGGKLGGVKITTLFIAI